MIGALSNAGQARFPWILGAVIVAVAVLYWPGLGGPAMLDDRGALADLLEVSEVPANWKALVFSDTGPLGRPIAMLSFLANLSLGGNDLWTWKATNLACHLALGILLFDISRRLAATQTWMERGEARFALVVATLWLIHPIQVSTVLYTVQRMTQLAALFTVLGVAIYLSARTSSAGNRASRLRLLSVYLVCLPLAALSKEVGLLLPLYLLVLEFTVLRDRRFSSDREFAYKLLIVFLALPVAAGTIHLAANFDHGIWQAHLRRGITLWERLLSESRVITQYALLVIAPARERLGFFHDDFPASTGFFAPVTTFFALVAILVALAWACLNALRRPLASCGLLWFLVGHSMEGGIIPLELMFEHRNYLPSYGLLLVMAAAIERVRPAVGHRSEIAVACAVAGIFGLVTHTVVRDWRTEQSLVTSSYLIHPRSERAVSSFASLLVHQGRHNAARKVLAGLPSAGTEVHRWLVDCKQYGEIADVSLGIERIGSEGMLSAYAVQGLMELAKLGLDGRCRFSTPRYADILLGATARPLGIVPNRQKLWVFAAHYAWKRDNRKLALTLLERAMQLTPEDPLPALLMSEWKLEAGDTAGALTALERGERIATKAGRDYSDAISSMRELLGRTGDGD